MIPDFMTFFYRKKVCSSQFTVYSQRGPLLMSSKATVGYMDAGWFWLQTVNCELQTGL
jgi:hypothetical protein